MKIACFILLFSSIASTRTYQPVNPFADNGKNRSISSQNKKYLTKTNPNLIKKLEKLAQNLETGNQISKKDFKKLNEHLKTLYSAIEKVSIYENSEALFKYRVKMFFAMKRLEYYSKRVKLINELFFKVHKAFYHEIKSGVKAEKLASIIKRQTQQEINKKRYIQYFAKYTNPFFYFVHDHEICPLLVEQVKERKLVLSSKPINNFLKNVKSVVSKNINLQGYSTKDLLADLRVIYEDRFARLNWLVNNEEVKTNTLLRP